MEEVDKIIIHTLKDIGCDIDADVRTLGDFSRNLIIEATVRCLEILNEETELPKSLPENMATRFHICASIAESCKAEGYNGEVGYQTFLYSTGPDVRRVLMFLIDKLPRETEKIIDEHEDEFSKVKERISVTLKEQLMERLKPGAVLSVPFLGHHLETGISCPGKQISSNPQEWKEYCRGELEWATNQLDPETLFPSIVSLLDSGSAGVAPTLQLKKPCKPAYRPVPKPRSSWLSLRSASALSILDESEKETINQEVEPEEIKELSIEICNEKDKKEQITNQIKDFTNRISEVEKSITVLTEKLNQVKEDCANVSRGRVMEVEARRKAFILLTSEDSSTVISETEKQIDEETQKILGLAQQWEKHRRPLIDKIRTARALVLSNQNENERQLEKLRDLREKIDNIDKEVASKNILKNKYETELSKIPRDINRSMYTRRILEIIGNIKKQKDDLDKILVETRQVQKDINLMTGRLERSFTFTNEHIFKNARKDESSRKAYKLLATLHSDCSDIVTLIQETGVIVREISDLEEQIEMEKSKKVGASLERISIDLKQMRPETELLKAQIEALS